MDDSSDLEVRVKSVEPGSGDYRPKDRNFSGCICVVEFVNV